ncbi:hypothetical protein [Capnocytophaga bilenii]
MSFFSKLLNNRGFIYNGQPLWKFKITNIEFKELTESLKKAIYLKDIDSKDVTLYYSEWWRRNYIGGKPSKELIYKSIFEKHKPSFTADEFYKLAKEGGEKLKFKWYKSLKNTLYFRTLLMQGGVPLECVKNDIGAYRSFLLSFLNLEPTSIDDIDESITRKLPKALQNEFFYESCLNVVNNILDTGNTELLESENNDLKNIGNELIKRSIELKEKRENNRYNKIKIRWKFDLSNFYLCFDFPKVIDNSDFCTIFKIRENDIKTDYKVLSDDGCIARFVKRNDNKFKVDTFLPKIKYDGESQPDIYLKWDDEAKDISFLIYKWLDLSIPLLWTTSIDEGEFLLEKSRFTSTSKAYLLYNSNYHLIDGSENKCSINLFGKEYYFTEISGVTKCYDKENNLYKFECNKASELDWYIFSKTPDGILKSNIKLIGEQKPIVYNKEGELIPNPDIQWRKLGNMCWEKWGKTLKEGVLEIKIKVGDIEEYDRVFYLGGLKIEQLKDLESPELHFKNTDFNISLIGYSTIYKTEINSNTKTVKFELLDKNKLPLSVKVRFADVAQKIGLLTYISSPFKGIEIIDNKGIVLPNETEFTTDNLKGLRLLVNTDTNVKYSVEFYNKKDYRLKIRKELSKTTALIDYADIFRALFGFYNIVDKENILCMSIYENNSLKPKKIYYIKPFSIQLDWIVVGNEIVINTNDKVDVVNDVVAIPLDCSIEFIDTINFSSFVSGFKINVETSIEKFIIFSKKEASIKIKPEFLSINPGNLPTNIEDRNQRIQKYCNELLNNSFDSEIWNKLLVYYYICIDNELPFTTFDILKAVPTSSLLAAKCFAFLSNHIDTFDYITFENDLGFSFHWVNIKDWGTLNIVEVIEAVKLMFFKSLHEDEELCMKIIRQGGFSKEIVINSEFNEVRSELGERILNELPRFSWKNIPEDYKKYLPNTNGDGRFNLLVATSLFIALSIKGKEDSIWGVDREDFRRNLKYIENLNYKWYIKSLEYYLQKV